MIRLAFLASNNGSSLRAIVSALEAGILDAEAVLAISNRKGAPALDFAREHGLQTLVIPTLADPDAADSRLANALGDCGAEWTILSGYLRKLGPATLARFHGRILNIHPALLPKYGGPGMYGRRVHEAVIAAGERVSGASVHVVDGEYDHGAVIARAEVPVSPEDTPESLEAKVMAVEPTLFVETLRRLAAGDIAFPA